MPGGDCYAAASGNAPRPGGYYKNMQYYLNAARLEFALQHCMPLNLSDESHNAFHPGCGTENADFIITNTDLKCDAKLLWDFSSLKQFFIDSLVNTGSKTFSVKRKFHDGDLILAFDNAAKKLYQIRRPTFIGSFNPDDEFWVKQLDIIVPNVIVDENGNFIVDKNENFLLISIEADPAEQIEYKLV